MAKFLTTNDISARLDGIIREAEQELVLVSPYVQLNTNLTDRLSEADKRGVRTTLIFGKEELKPAEQKKVAALKHISLYFKPELHAKCYYNEKQLIIASMNLYDFSEKKNREMGVLVQKDEDGGVYTEAVAEVKLILSSSELVKRETPLSAAGKVLTGFASRVTKEVIGNPKDGFCIRCQRKIDFDPDKPFCPNCYSKWASFGNPDYAEQWCLDCGKASKTSKAKPLCKACYRKS